MNQIIQLNLINNSYDTNNSSIMILQKNAATDFDEIDIAWRVIKNLGRGCRHPFTYSMNVQAGAEDSYGNFTPEMSADDGDAFEMVKDPSGNILRKATTAASSPNDIEIRNALEIGAMSALIYRDGHVCARKSNLAPGQKAVFSFQPRIYLAVVSQINQGEEVTTAILSAANTAIDLRSVETADIILEGGGAGPEATPFVFRLANVNGEAEQEVETVPEVTAEKPAKTEKPVKAVKAAE